MKRSKGVGMQSIERSRNTQSQLEWYARRNDFIKNLSIPPTVQFEAFPVFATRQIITRFLELYEVFKLIIDVPGSIIECGTGRGLGLMSFAHFATIFEPYHYTRKIVGFDTFKGFPKLTKQDLTSSAEHMKKGGLAFDFYEILKDAIKIFDQNRPIGHIQKVDVIKGDICKTLPEYIAKNPHLLVALLYLDLDLYAPTSKTLELLKDRFAKGSIIVFDELNHQDYPGETIAVMELPGLRNLRLKRFPFATMSSYVVVE